MTETPNTRTYRRAVKRRRAAAPRTTFLGSEVGPSAREWFTYLRPMLLASRPVVGTRARHIPGPRNPDGSVPMTTEPIYGKPTFRNVIDEQGRHV